MMIKKAVVPAAGFGTRFLPWTKAMAKGMLPVVDKPVIQIVIEQLVEAGIEEIYLVISPEDKDKALLNHFRQNQLLEDQLQKADKKNELKIVKELGRLVKIHPVYQTAKDSYGNGTPLLLVTKFLKDEPFIYCWGDEFILARPPVMNQAIKAFKDHQSSIITVIKAAKDEDYQRYGFIAGKRISQNILRIEKVVEKPGKQNAPSDLATVSPFIFTPLIFKAIRQAAKERLADKELYYNDAIKLLLKTEPFYALEIKNYRYYDTGNKLEYLKTVVESALENSEIKEKFKAYLEEILPLKDNPKEK